MLFRSSEHGMLVCSFGIVASCNGEFPIQLIHRHIGWELTDADQSVWSFDKYGILRYVTDVNGFKTVSDFPAHHICKKLFQHLEETVP